MRNFFCVFAVFFATGALADTLTLKSGRSIQGTYLGGSARDVRMDTGDRVETIPVDQISSLQFQGSGNGIGNSADSAPPPRVRSSERATIMRPDASESSPAAYRMELPAGTNITIRMIDHVDSDVARLGDTFHASIDEPVSVNGESVIPRGSDVVVKLVDDKKSGRIRGQTALTLALSAISVNGRMVDVTSSDVTQASASRGSRSTKVIGGTTALGAVIGGIAGGGRGAAIGAASGAAVGTGVEVVTAGQKVKIPSETRLTFSLSYPVRI